MARLVAVLLGARPQNNIKSRNTVHSNDLYLDPIASIIYSEYAMILLYCMVVI